MKFRYISFRTRITLTLVIVISFTSYLSFQLYHDYVSRRIYQEAEGNFETLLHFFRNELITIHDGKLIKSLLADMEKEKRVLKTYLINEDGKFISSTKDTILAKGDVRLNELHKIKEDITVITNSKATPPYSRAILRVKNNPACYSCHSPDTNSLGYIVIDFSLVETRNNIAFNMQSSMLFTLVMLILIMIFVAVLHYRFVKKSLSNFKIAIQEINNGNLDKRVEISESAELGMLGGNFNRMLDQFQNTQNELNKYHQKELNDANKLATIGEMAARLAHEVRNPLMGIANSIEILVGEMKDSPDKPILEELQRQARRVNQAISNLLKFSRSTEIHLETASINEIVASLTFFLKNQKQNKRIQIEADLQDDIPKFRFDAEQLENVLLNLGINAIQAIEKEGIVRYRTTYYPGEKVVQIEVSDTGSGIPADKSEQVFNPFFTTRTEGTGLGLAIVKDIITNHKGSIRFISNESKGTTFIIQLPAIL